MPAVVDNFALCQAEMQKVREEVDTSLRTKNVSQDMQNPLYRLAVIKGLFPKVGHVPIASHIAKKGAGILNELDGQREQVTKGSRTVTEGRTTVTFKFFCGVDGSLTERMMEKLKPHAQASFHLSRSI